MGDKTRVTTGCAAPLCTKQAYAHAHAHTQRQAKACARATSRTMACLSNKAAKVATPRAGFPNAARVARRRCARPQALSGSNVGSGERLVNFSAGPACVYEEVLLKAQKDLLNFEQSAGLSVMEMSHRGKAFTRIIEEAEADLRELLSIPEDYSVLFMQG